VHECLKQLDSAPSGQDGAHLSGGARSLLCNDSAKFRDPSHFDPAGRLTKTSRLIFCFRVLRLQPADLFLDVDPPWVTVQGLISVPLALLWALTDPVAIASSDAAAIPIALIRIMIASPLCDNR
jgi:hypothetical protein